MYEQKGVIDKVRSFDFYGKQSKNYLEATCVGALLTIITIILSIYLFIFEFSRYFDDTIKSEMNADLSSGSETLKVNFDITLHHFPCELANLDIADKMGGHTIKPEGNLIKQDLDSNGKVLGQKVHNDEPFKNEEELFQRAKRGIKDNKGCRIAGFFKTSRVPGNFHISSHPFKDIIIRLQNEINYKMNLTYTINHLSFGEDADVNKIMQKGFKIGYVHPLDKVGAKDNERVNIFENYLNIVPTIYRIDGKDITTYQFTVTTNVVNYLPMMFPAIFFRLDIHPVVIINSKIKPNVTNRIVNICAIIGGMFTIAGILDSIIVNFLRRRKKNVGNK